MYNRLRDHTIARFTEDLYRYVNKSNWECLNTIPENYNCKAFSQNSSIIKYKMDLTNGDIATIYFTVDKAQNKYNVEVIFVEDTATIYELPLSEECYLNLKELEAELTYLNERKRDSLIEQHLRF